MTTTVPDPIASDPIVTTGELTPELLEYTAALGLARQADAELEAATAAYSAALASHRAAAYRLSDARHAFVSTDLAATVPPAEVTA